MTEMPRAIFSRGRLGNKPFKAVIEISGLFCSSLPSRRSTSVVNNCVCGSYSIKWKLKFCKVAY